jgi:hypothetical protein
MARTMRREMIYGADGRAIERKTHRDGKTGYIMSRRTDEKAHKKTEKAKAIAKAWDEAARYLAVAA